VKEPGGYLSLAKSLGLEAEMMLDHWFWNASRTTEIDQSVLADLQIIVDDTGVTADLIEGPVSRLARTLLTSW
jgi:hypothetical protein